MTAKATNASVDRRDHLKPKSLNTRTRYWKSAAMQVPMRLVVSAALAPFQPTISSIYGRSSVSGRSLVLMTGWIQRQTNEQDADRATADIHRRRVPWKRCAPMRRGRRGAGARSNGDDGWADCRWSWSWSWRGLGRHHWRDLRWPGVSRPGVSRPR